MKKILLIISIALYATTNGFAQCNVTNATSCWCPDSTATTCELLPDITLSAWALINYSSGPDEYAQTGAGANNGRLRISASTPNIGFGSFTVRGQDINNQYHYVCGTDTFISATIPAACADGSAPKHLIHQRVYSKNGNAMTFTDYRAGAMTYHPTHGHNHVDDWGVFTLRLENPNDPNPLNWEIVGDGAKVGFCLMDYGSCNFYNGHCRDSLDNVMTSVDFPNYGLGGGNYGCSPVEQGISSGYTDIYSKNLDGMWINIPPNTCNGNYWIVAEVDPHNYFKESRDDNNWMAVPYTLTQQTAPGTGYAAIENQTGSVTLCQGENLTLRANAGYSYTWSNGATTRSITINSAGNYSVTVTSPCGTATSNPLQVNMLNTPLAPSTSGTTVCENDAATVTASGTNSINWFGQPSGGMALGTGNSYTSMPLSTTTSFYAADVNSTPSSNYFNQPNDSAVGGGGYLNSNQYLIFDCVVPVVIKTVKVYAQAAGNRTINLTNASGTVMSSATVNLPAGESRATLNFQVPAGTNYNLRTSGTINLFRNNTGVSYPYDIPGVVSITGSSAGAGFYYFYYDWEVEVPGTSCYSLRTAAVANVNPLPAVDITGLDTIYPSNATAVVMTGIPSGGIFSGIGVTGNTFDPASAGVGGPYPITYEFTDVNGCSNTKVIDVTVSLSTAIAIDKNLAGVNVYPNPTAGVAYVSFGNMLLQQVTLTLTDNLGKVVMHKKLSSPKANHTETLDLTGLAKGAYLIKISTAESESFRKLFVQ